MQEEDAVVILADGFDGISAAGDKVGDVELELDVFGIHGVHDAVKIGGAFAEGVEMVVIAEGDTEVRGALAHFGEEAADALALIRRGGAGIGGELVEDLQVEAAGILEESGVGNVLGDFVGFGLVEGDFAAGESDEGELEFSEEFFELGGFEVGDGVGAELDTGKSYGGDVVCGLTLFIGPGDGGVAEADVPGGGEDGKGVGGGDCSETGEEGTTCGLRTHV